MANTGSPIKDALNSLAAHLTVKKTDWTVKHIYAYPAHVEVGCPASSITLAVGSGGSIDISHVGGLVDYKIPIIITYLATGRDPETQYHDAADTLAKIAQYLIENPVPDSFGEVLAVNDGGIDIFEFPESAEPSNVYQAQLQIIFSTEVTI